MDKKILDKGVHISYHLLGLCHSIGRCPIISRLNRTNVRGFCINGGIFLIFFILFGLLHSALAQPDAVNSYSDTAFRLDKSSDAPISIQASGFWSGMTDVVVRDTLAYCAMYGGLLILDVSDPSAPEPVSRQYLPEGWATDIRIVGDYAYISAWSEAFYIIDISDPLLPSIAGKYTLPAHSYGLAVQDTLAFVTYATGFDDNHGLLILDISDPSNIELIRDESFPGHHVGIVVKVEIDGDYAYVAAGIYLWILDITDPSAPVTVSMFETGYWVFGLVVRDTLVYIADLDRISPAGRSAFTIVNVADRSDPKIVYQWEMLFTVYDVFVYGDIAYVTNDIFGVHIIDISDPTAPDSLGSYRTPGVGGRVVGNDSLIYIVDAGPPNNFKSLPEETEPSMGDFQIVDVRNPNDPQLTGVYHLPPEITGVIAGDEYVYALYGDGISPGGILVGRINGSDIDSVGSYETTGTPNNGVIVNDTLYLAADGRGLEVIDISDPANLSCVRNYSASWGLDVVIRDGYAYLAAASGVRIFDITKTDDVPVASIGTPSKAESVCLYGDYLYIACLIDGVSIYNISDPATPVYIDLLPTGIANGVEICHGRLYIETNNPFYIYAISNDPENPEYLGFYSGDPLMGNQDIHAFDNYVIFTSGYSGIDILYVSDPTDIQLEYNINTSGFAGEIAENSEYLLVSDAWGLMAFKKSIITDAGTSEPDPLPEYFYLSQNYPNPFNLETTIEFEVPYRTRVVMEIYNLLGKEVRQLIDRSYPAGEYSVSWDGRDSNGDITASGLYFYRISFDGIMQSKKMILVK